MPRYTASDLFWSWSYTQRRRVVYLNHSTGPLYMGRTWDEAVASLDEVN